MKKNNYFRILVSVLLMITLLFNFQVFADNTSTITQENLYQTINYPDGSKYIGEVKYNMRNGYGTLFYSTNDEKKRLRYDGEWKNNKREGFGTLVWTNGAKLTSLKWENDDLNDLVIIDNKDGNVYCGKVIKGVPEGVGISIEPQATFVGEWKDGLPNGLNIVIEDGIKYVEIFNDNKITQVIYNSISDILDNDDNNDDNNNDTSNNDDKSNIKEYLNIKKVQYEKEISDLQQQIENVKAEKNVKILVGSEWIWDYDHVKVDELQKRYDKKLSDFKAWKALNGIK